ncbi:hypothetical protein [Streptomyces sp. ISL-98]|uniref:hypothetical protein n=1 Tax=Streptomyces sp. ISL-98 TaxID=2819192 RepID=UPI0035AE16F5
MAGDFTRYDVHAVREHRCSIDLVRYRFFGNEHVGLETVASVTGQSAARRAALRRRAAEVARARRAEGRWLKANPKEVDLAPGFTGTRSGRTA